MPRTPIDLAPNPNDTASQPLDTLDMVAQLETQLEEDDGASLDPVALGAEYRRLEFVEHLLTEIEGLQRERPERAKNLAALALRLAARLPNATFARAWDLWAASCHELGLDGQADAARMIAGLYDPSLQQAQPFGQRGKPSKRRKRGQ